MMRKHDYDLIFFYDSTKHFQYTTLVNNPNEWWHSVCVCVGGGLHTIQAQQE